MEIKLACECGQKVLVDAAAGGQEFNCPSCEANMTVPPLVEVSSLPPLEDTQASAQALNTTTIELMCVGNVGNGYINAQIAVYWFEVLADPEKKHVDVIQHHIPIKSHRREQRINFCEFDIPNHAVCHVTRHIQTKPNLDETKFFDVQDGQFHPLADGCVFDFSRFFLGDYKGYSFRQSDAKNRN